MPTLSPDGKWRWNGTEWVPLVAGTTRPPGLLSERVPTSWTKPMRYLVATFFGAQALFVGSLPFWYIRTMTLWADAMNRQNQQLNPGDPTPPPDLMANIDAQMTVALYVMVVVLAAISLAALIGALSRWMAAFYVILGLLCLETLYLVFGVVGTLVESLATSALIGQSLGPPAWMIWTEAGFGIPAAALFVWMLIATVRRGPWAMRNAPADGPAHAREVQSA